MTDDRFLLTTVFLKTLMNPNDVAITNCDLEPVHIPGRIQSFGALIAFDINTMRITYRSENITVMFPHIQREILGTTIGDFASGSNLAHALRGAMGLPTLTTMRERIGSLKIGNRFADVSISIHQQTAVVEFEAASSSDSSSYQTPVARLKSTLVGLQSHQVLDTLLQSATNALRRMTGFDRVMTYRFLHDDSGEVVAEARSPGVEPYLGLRYPASDIPKQVRDLMVRVPFRLIGNVDDPHVDVVADDSQSPAPPLDLSLTHLRGVSPIHVQYLKNMGVASTMNLSIIVHGRLWGLFAFHHYHPNQIGPNERSLCELFGHFASLEIQQQIDTQRLTRDRRTESVLQSLRSSPTTSLADCVTDNANVLMETMNCHGVSLISDQQITSCGLVPDDAVIDRLTKLTQDDVLALDNLSKAQDRSGEKLGDTSATAAAAPNSPKSSADSPPVEIAGAMICRLNRQPGSWIVFFRNSVHQEIRWAGKDTKTVHSGPDGPLLMPRSSFAEYCETVEDQCERWTRSDYKTGAAIGSTLRSLDYTNTDELAAELRRSNEHQSILIAELNHRVRNIITLVRSIARQTSTHSQSLQQFIGDFEKRLMALATAHNLIGSSGIQRASLRKIVNIELKAYRSATGESITIAGPEITLAADVVAIMTLVIHELATNAVKHGALSQSGVRLDISWANQSGGLRLVWAEKVKHPLEQPQKINFGLSLIQQAIPAEIDGEVKLDFQPDGLTVTCWLPATSYHLTASPDAFPLDQTDQTPALDPPPILPQGCRTLKALVLEDKSILAMEMQTMLNVLGFTQVLTFARTDTHLSDEQLQSIEIAILDVDLGRHGTSFEFAARLLKLAVPIIFISGFDDSFQFPQPLKSAPRLSKPVSIMDLKMAITQVTRVDL